MGDAEAQDTVHVQFAHRLLCGRAAGGLAMRRNRAGRWRLSLEVLEVLALKALEPELQLLRNISA